MTLDPSRKNAPVKADLVTALTLGRARHRGRPWGPPARSLLSSCGGRSDVDAQGEAQSLMTAEPALRFLVIDNRYGTPIHVILEMDPTAEPGFPGFGVLVVTLESPGLSHGMGVPAGIAIGRDPHQLDRFRAFGSDRAAAGAGFILIEPRYVGPSWPSYVLAFQPGGLKSSKRLE